jgi:signal transduction histidine kinase
MFLLPSDEIASREMRTIIFAPFVRDAELISAVVARLGKPVLAVHSVPDLCEQIRAGAGAAIVAEEGVKGPDREPLHLALSEQPPWSDFPLLFLVAGGRVTAQSERLRKRRMPLGNVLLLERPVRPETLLRTLEMALRGRERQYQIRDQMEKAALAQEALRRSEKLAVTGRLAASIAHEINNPLEAVTNLLYLTRTEPASDQMRLYLTQIEEELARVTEIAKHTLRFYREPARPTPVNLVPVLESILSLYNSRLLAAGVTVRKRLRQPEVVVHASPGELRQVIANIVGNALDAMPGGGCLCLRLSVQTHGPTPQARLTIADTGSGIPPEIRSAIFEPFFTTKGETGTGLGLWVISEITEKNGWSIRVRSRSTGPRRGTAFSILIPL